MDQDEDKDEDEEDIDIDKERKQTESLPCLQKGLNISQITSINTIYLL